MTHVSSSLTIWLPEVLHAIATLLDSWATNWFHKQEHMRAALDAMATSTILGAAYRALIGFARFILRLESCRITLHRRFISALVSMVHALKTKARAGFCWLRDMIEWIIMTLD